MSDGEGDFLQSCITALRYLIDKKARLARAMWDQQHERSSPVSEFIKIKDTNGVRTIWMDRPAAKNAITHAMYTAIADTLLDAQTNKAVKVVVLTGAGDAFTAGNDLQDFMQTPPHLGGDEPRPVERFLRGILEAEKILIAGVNGVAVGVGATMLLHCDFVVAAKSAKISAPFVDLGLVPEAASSLLLPMVVGPRKAAQMFMLGTSISGEEAAECGLATSCVDDDVFEAELMALAQTLAAKAPTALRNTKMLLRKNTAAAAQRMAEEGALFAQGLKSPEFAEAAGAFMQKRPPDFSKFG